MNSWFQAHQFGRTNGGWNGPYPPNRSQHGRVTRSQATDNARAGQDTQRYSGNTVSTSQNINRTVSDLRSTLRSREDQLRNEQRCNESLRARNSTLREDVKRWEQESAEWEKDYNDVTDKYSYVVENHLLPYAQKKGLSYEDRTGQAIDSVLGPLVQDATQAEKLRLQNQKLWNQVQALQQQMLAKVDKVQVMSDDALAQEFRSLASSIRTLSRSVRLAGDSKNIISLLDLCLLHRAAPYHWTVRTKRKSIIEAEIWSILLQLIFHSPFAFLGHYCNAISDSWTLIFGKEHQHEWPSPSTRCETWRSTTADRLVQGAGSQAIAHGQAASVPGALGESVCSARLLVSVVIERHLDMMSPTSDSSQIHHIVDKAFTLAMQMSLQRSRLQLIHPSVGAAFNASEMVSLPDEHGEDMIRGTVGFVVNPGLAKWGDAHGMNFEDRYDIVPSLVHLDAVRPEDQEYDTGVAFKMEESQADAMVDESSHIKAEVEDENRGGRGIKTESE